MSHQVCDSLNLWISAIVPGPISDKWEFQIPHKTKVSNKQDQFCMSILGIMNKDTKQMTKKIVINSVPI